MKYIIDTFIALSILFCSSVLSANIIEIPTDADNLRDAVELAASGDQIHIVSDTFYWTPIHKFGDTVYGATDWVIVNNKNLSIHGLSEDNHSAVQEVNYGLLGGKKNYSMWIENSNVSIHNISLPLIMTSVDYDGWGGVFPSPIRIESGTLEINNCDFTTFIECKGNITLNNSTLYGYSWLSAYAYNKLTKLYPVIHFFDSSNIMARFINSSVEPITEKGFNNVIFENITDSSIFINNSSFYGKTYTVGYGSYPADLNGSDAIRFLNCQGLDIQSLSSYFEGGHGYHARSHRHGIIEGGGNGGSGLRFIDTQANVTFGGYNRFYGGDGGDGISVEALSPEFQRPNVDKYIVIDGGNGGDGITLINSHINYSYLDENVFNSFRWGLGGHGNMINGITAKSGQLGESIFVDENSTWVSTTSVFDWMIYE